MAKPPVTETAQEARQGLRGRPVLVVLIVALLLAIFAWGGVEFYGEKIDNKAGVQAEKSDNQSTPKFDTSGDMPTTNTPVDKNPAPQTGSSGPSQTNNPN